MIIIIVTAVETSNLTLEIEVHAFSTPAIDEGDHSASLQLVKEPSVPKAGWNPEPVLDTVVTVKKILSNREHNTDHTVSDCFID
jgi:hypothetical protein